MKWWLLQKRKCPKCEYKIKSKLGIQGRRAGMTIGRYCSNENCDFSIGIEKFSQIVGNIRQKQINKRRSMNY